MFKLIISCIFVFIIIPNFLVLGSKKVWGYKNMKKLSKSDVDVRTFLFPCTMDEEKFLNSTLGRSHKHLHNCKKKLVIKMTVNSGGEHCSMSDGFIPIDHVVDGITGRKKRLLSPLMIRIKREKMYQLYDLQLIKSINAEAKEEVKNNENAANFTGCDTSSSHPTCGFSFFNNKIIQFSEGFCCSCDQNKNDERQPCEGHPADKKLSAMTQYAIRHHRSNRSSRDLETFDPKLELNSVNLDEEKVMEDKENNIYDHIDDLEVLKEGIVKSGNIGFANLEDTKEVDENDVTSNLVYDKSVDKDSLCNNITIRSFEFEHTHAPDDVLGENPPNMSKFDFVIESTADESKRGENSKYFVMSNNSISQERLKLLMMNKIKKTKNEEKIPSTFLPSKEEVKLPIKSRSLNPASRDADDLLTHGKGSFSLKLTNSDGELEIQVVTKRTKELAENKPTDQNRERSSNNFTLAKNNKSTRSSLKDLMKCFKSQKLTSSTTASTLPKENLVKSENTKENNNSEVEHIVYKLVPIINTVHASSESNNFEKAKFVLKDTENTTRNIFIKLNKRSGVQAPHIQTSSATRDNVFLNNLNDMQFSNKPVQIQNSKLLKSHMVLENSSKNHPQGELQGQLLESVSSPTNPVINDHYQIIEKRETCNRQLRGGQSCSQKNKKLPCFANPETYFESAHCLRFSDLWYNVHRLINPRMENSINIRIYAKHKTSDKRICWENLTKRLPGRVGTINEVLTDDQGNIVISYSSNDKIAFSLDCAGDYLLVPQPLTKHCKDSELKTLSCGGPGEYLILKENEITFDGDDCDKAGVTYSAFARQPHRCQHETGTCLKNQPLHFWRDDKKAAAEGKQGQYFLNNFITTSDQSILQNTTSNQVVLRALYYERYQSSIVVEVNADHIEIVADRSEGQITEVYIDATSDKFTIVKAIVTNLGMSADLFGVDFANCSYPIGPSDFDKPGKDEIAPQYRLSYTATIYSPLEHKRTECSLVLYNVDQELVASRHILIVQGQRCMCVWHCECVCIDYPNPGSLCTPLSVRNYNLAGFPGQLPVISGTDCDTLFIVLEGLIWFFIYLIIFGLIKAVLGLCLSYIGVWGLWYILPEEARCLYCYMEPHLACYSIAHDYQGFPVHPQTFQRTVRFLPWYSEFSVNVFFFICVLRTCLCDRVSRKASSMMFPQQQYQPMAPCGGAREQCSPGCSSMRGSVCSNRKKFRMSAGGAPQARNPDPQTVADDELAKRLVNELTRAYVVYRNLSRPIGGVQSVPGAPYCIRGFFLESDNGFYQFNPPSPLMQIWQMNHSPLEPPVVLDPAPFRVIYRNAQEVLATRELSPKARGVVINAP